MKINPSVARGVYRSSAYKAGTVSAGQASARQPERAGNTDQISISAAAAKQLETEKLSKSIVDELNMPTSPERIARLRGQVQSGSYYIPTEKLADALMQRWFGL